MASCFSWEVDLSDIPEVNCAQSRDRTGTILLSLVFETSASTNSAIWAYAASPLVKKYTVRRGGQYLVEFNYF